MTRIFNRRDEIEKRRALRNNMTKAEKLLWQRLRKRQIREKRFLRQFGIDKYFVDFYCPELKLAVEVDGVTHNSVYEMEYDLVRQDEIEYYGITFLRVKNKEIFENINNVVSKVEEKIDDIGSYDGPPP